MFLLIDPIPSPEVSVSSVSRDEIVLEWNPVSFFCPSLHYNITTNGCDISCDVVNFTKAVCHSFALSPVTNLCTIGVQSVICSNVTGSPSNVLFNLKGNPL